MHTAARWPEKDRIAWVEERLRERIAAEKRCTEQKANEPDVINYGIDDKELKRIPDRLSLEVWLAKERDKLSWQQIVIKYLPQYITSEAAGAGISKARRCHAAVERALEPTGEQSIKNYLDDRIEQVFDCTPEEFKKYLDSIRTGKRRK